MKILLFILLYASQIYGQNNMQITMYRYSIVHENKQRNQTFSTIWFDHISDSYITISKDKNTINPNETTLIDINKIKEIAPCFKSSVTNDRLFFKLGYGKKKYVRKNWKYNIRKEILKQENLIPINEREYFSNQNINGLWYDHYTDSYFTNEKLLQVDHFIPLSHANFSGGKAWNSKQKKEFANNTNSPAALILTFSKANLEKRDSTPWNYIPPNPKFQKIYVEIWNDLKNEFGLEKYNVPIKNQENNILSTINMI